MTKKIEKEDTREKMQRFREKKETKEVGITLIALVVTIVVLLILAGVTINMVFSDNGIIKQAQKVAEAQKVAQDKDSILTMLAEYEVDRVTSDKSLYEYFTEQKESGEISDAVENEDGSVNITLNDGAKYQVSDDGTITALHTHDWKETAHVEATCGDDGYTEYVCTVGGETKREVIATTGNHNYVNNVCTVCGHEYGWTVPTGGTYTTGETTYTAGQKVTTDPVSGDIFILGDYEYRYNYYYN